MNKSPAIKILLGIFLVLMVVSCNKNSSLSSTSQSKAFFDYFDTVSYVYSYANDSGKVFEENAEAVASVLENYHKLLDIYHEYSGINNLCTINRNAGKDPVKVEPELIEFLDYAKQMYTTTNGTMNIAMGSVLKLWHEARISDVHFVPSKESLQEASKHILIDSLEINHKDCTVRLTDKDSSLDVGALGKGYSAEKAAEVLENKGVSAYVLNIGGNVRIIGTKADGSGWKTGIRNPNNPDGPFAMTLDIKNCSCVTSGTYERFFIVDGVKYHHIIDSETLMPAGFFESVTVICHDSALADAISTSLFCMPYAEGLALVDSLDVDCIWIYSNGDIVYSTGIEDLILD